MIAPTYYAAVAAINRLITAGEISPTSIIFSEHATGRLKYGRFIVDSADIAIIPKSTNAALMGKYIQPTEPDETTRARN